MVEPPEDGLPGLKDSPSKVTPIGTLIVDAARSLQSGSVTRRRPEVKAAFRAAAESTVPLHSIPSEFCLEGLVLRPDLDRLSRERPLGLLNGKSFGEDWHGWRRNANSAGGMLWSNYATRHGRLAATN